MANSWYFSCRHTFEDTLQEEIGRFGAQPSSCKVVTPGLLRVNDAALSAETPPAAWDLTYALQVIPDAHAIGSKEASISSLAKDAIAAVGLGEGGESVEALRCARKGSLAIHALVPDQFRGVPLSKAKMHRRSASIVDKISKTLKVTFPAARGAKGGVAAVGGEEAWLMQVLLLDNDRAAVSLTQCAHVDADQSTLGGHVGVDQSTLGGTWPCWHLEAGLADVDIDKITEPMPSSAYRKLEEAFRTMGVSPASSESCVDLGACPGGWTKALRRYGASVTAVDRSALHPELMRDPGVSFVQGDAFTFSPMDTENGGGGEPVAWMVSDIIAEPHRVGELLETWCGGKWARRMVVTIKFKGAPDWGQVERARAVAEGGGYAFRAKHFFNNKNEVTLMLSQRQC